MNGEKRELITMTCTTCQKKVAMCVDPDDVRRHMDGMLVQDAFSDRDGVPYLTAAEREMWISGCCDECWHTLCPSDPMAYN